MNNCQFRICSQWVDPIKQEVVIVEEFNRRLAGKAATLPLGGPSLPATVTGSQYKRIPFLRG